MRKLGFVSILLLLIQLILQGPILAGKEAQVPPRSSPELIPETSTLAKMALDADLIIVGEVTGIASHWNVQSTAIMSDLTVALEICLKGEQPTTPLVVIVEGGQVGGIRMAVSGFPTYQTSDRVVLFLKSLGSGRYSILSRQNGVYFLNGNRVENGAELPDFLSQISNLVLGKGPVSSPPLLSPNILPKANTLELAPTSASNPEITSIIKASGSAGTGAQVIINGRNFGATKGASKVTFYYKSGQPRMTAPTVFWADTCVVATIPVGIINGYQASAASGQVLVTTSNGDSNPFQFSVTFGYQGQKWTQSNPVVRFYTNSASSGIAGTDLAIQDAAQTWNNLQGTAFQFVAYGSTNATAPAFNGLNEILWGDLGASGPLANTTSWYDASGNILEFDIQFNNSDAWSTNGTSGTYDIQSVVTHELGHALGLRDLYGDVGSPNDMSKMMFGRIAAGQLKRSLTADDIAGISWIYPSLTEVKLGGRGYGPFAITANSVTNCIYLTNSRSDSVTVFDGTNNLLLASVNVGSSPQGIAVDPLTNRIFVSNSFGDTVSVIDGASHLVTGLIKVGNNPFRLAFNPTNKRVYVANYGSNTVSVIDAINNTVVSTLSVGINPSGVGVNPAKNLIYISNDGSDNVSVIDANTNSVTANISVGSSPGSIAVNQAGDRVYVVNFGSNNISVINTDNNTVSANISVGLSPRGIDINPSLNRVYVTNSAGNTLTVIDAVTNAVVSTIAVGDEPDGVCVNSVTGRIYVANYLSNSFSVILPNQTSVLGSFSTGSGPDSIRFNSSNGLIYAVNSASNMLSIINPSDTGQIITRPTGNLPSGLDINPVTNRIYVANSGNNTLMVFDGVSHNLTATISVGNRPAGVAVNSTTNRIYVSNNGESSVSVIDGASNNVTATIGVGTLPLGLAINAITNRVYVANNLSNTLSVIDGFNNTVMTSLSVGTWPFEVAVNSITNRIYVANNGSNNVAVVDGLNNTMITKIGVGIEPRGITVNSFKNRIWVANYGSNSLSMIDGLNNLAIATMNVPKGPRGVAHIANANEIWATAFWSASVAVLQDTFTASGPATALSIGVQPASVNLTTRELIIQPVVTLIDLKGEVVTNSTAAVSLNITQGTGSPSAALTGVSTLPAIFGTTTFKGLSVGLSGKGYTLTANSGNLTSAISLSFDLINAGDADLNGLISMGDVTKVERVILGLDPTTIGCDANEDNLVNMGDVTKIERIILGFDPLR